MKRFARLYTELDATTSTTAKVAALRRYFAQVDPADAAWASYFLAGGRPRRAVSSTTLRALACELADIDDWLFEACYQAVGDLAETVAHVLPPPTRGESACGLAAWIEQRLLPLRTLPADEQAAAVRACWDELDATGRFLFIKLIGGGWRVGVSQWLVQRALAAHAGLDPALLAQRMMGYTDAARRPDAAAFLALIAPAQQGVAREGGQPYPFFLAHPLPGTTGVGSSPPSGPGDAEDGGEGRDHAPSPKGFLHESWVHESWLQQRLGPPSDWIIEWKYDGIRAQIVRRGDGVWIWSRGEELVTESFPEVAAQAASLPEGTVLDGELLVWPDGEARPATFARLQQRIGRRKPGRKLLQEQPVRFVAYDLLEWAGTDCRAEPQHRRRERLECAVNAPGLGQGPGLRLSPALPAASWPEAIALRDSAREQGVEGLMLKHRQAVYGIGRRKSEGADAWRAGWWKWKLEPMSVDGVLVYAQAGHGRRAGLYTDYSFAVWSRPPRDAAEAQAVVEAIAARHPPPPDDDPQALRLVPFAKAYSGLTDEEFKAVDRLVRGSTLEKFGPVRSLRPGLVVELGFEGLSRSRRHRSGIALRFPRMRRLRPDKPLHEADSLEVLESLLRAREGASS